MTFEEYKKWVEIEPAKITTEVDDKGKMTFDIEGRQSEIIPLLVNLTLQIIEESTHSIDEYCDFLKLAAARTKAVDNIIKGVFD